jgi:glycosyltransferase involved in cell wall biosynthesis
MLKEEVYLNTNYYNDNIISLKHNKGKKITAVIPVLNEENTIGNIIDKTQKYVDNILIVDGNSQDNTVEVAKKKGVNIITQRGKGKGDAVVQALKSVHSEIVIMMDGDGSMRPEEIPLFVNKIIIGADLVKGSRFTLYGKSEDITLLRRFGNNLLVFLVNFIFRANFTDLCYGFMAFNSKAIEKLKNVLVSKRFNIETEILIKAKKYNLSIVEVPSIELKRTHGVSKLRIFRDGLNILSTIIRETVSMTK